MVWLMVWGLKIDYMAHTRTVSGSVQTSHRYRRFGPHRPVALENLQRDETQCRHQQCADHEQKAARERRSRADQPTDDDLRKEAADPLQLTKPGNALRKLPGVRSITTDHTGPKPPYRKNPAADKPTMLVCAVSTL